MAPRISRKNVGLNFTLKFVGGSGNSTHIDPDHHLLRVWGTEDQRARFAYRPTDQSPEHWYEWEAYRYNGRWAYGTSADPLHVVAAK